MKDWGSQDAAGFISEIGCSSHPLIGRIYSMLEKLQPQMEAAGASVCCQGCQDLHLVLNALFWKEAKEQHDWKLGQSVRVPLTPHEQIYYRF